jgi:hypothetical protein
MIFSGIAKGSPGGRSSDIGKAEDRLKGYVARFAEA